MDTGAFGEARVVYNRVFFSLKLSQILPLMCIVFQDYALFLGRPICM